MNSKLPVLKLQGSPEEQGYLHGLQEGEQIAHNLKIYFRRFEHEAKLTREEVLYRARKYLEVIEERAPDYAAAMRGVAQGSGLSLLEITALNARYEIIYSELSHQGKLDLDRDSCTAFAALPTMTASGHLILGQNWDWIPEIRGLILKIFQENGLDILCFTEAGIVGGKIGLNSAGLGLLINGLHSDADDWSRLGKPFHVRCWEILHSKTIDEAIDAVTGMPRACSANFLIAQVPDEVINIEAAPHCHRFICPQNSFIAHANHFEDPAVLGIREPQVEKRPSSHQRNARMQKLLWEKERIDLQAAQEILRDHDDYPYSICRHADESFPVDERYQTVVSVVMDLNEKQFMIANGPPCQNHYRLISLYC